MWALWICMRTSRHAAMKVVHSSPEVLSILCSDEFYVPMPWVPPSSSQDMRALQRHHRVIMDESDYGICARCKTSYCELDCNLVRRLHVGGCCVRAAGKMMKQGVLLCVGWAGTHS